MQVKARQASGVRLHASRFWLWTSPLRLICGADWAGNILFVNGDS